MTPDDVNSAMSDLIEAWYDRPYDAFDSNWICLIRLANLFDDKAEHKRLKRLLDLVPSDAATHLLHQPSVEALISIDPPLESLVSNKHEEIDREKANDLMNTVRTAKDSDAKAGVLALAEILKRIRNRRAHGFKTPDGPRDEEILGKSAEVLRFMVILAAESLMEIAQLEDR